MQVKLCAKLASGVWLVAGWMAMAQNQSERILSDHFPPESAAPVSETPQKLPLAVPLDPDTLFHRVIVGADRGQAATQSERMIYSNTLGNFKVNFPTNQPISDDIAITASNGCNLTRYRFKVLGKVLPTGASGPYSLTYGLYSNCPLAVGSTTAARDLVKIPGTEGVLNFDDDAPREIEHIIDPENPVALPTNFYLSLRFNRLNCGTVVGAPALEGFSGDVWDFPGFPCNGSLGGFPTLPHASMWAEFFGDKACPEAHLGYKSARASGGTSTIGSNVQGVDDLQLLGGECQMVSYEVTVRGIGFYNFELRSACTGQVIEGTQRTHIIPVNSTPLLQTARFDFDPPIAIPASLWLGYKVSVNSSGAVIAGIRPWVGNSDNLVYIHDVKGCSPTFATQGVHGAINASIVCAGPPPMGACCDPHVRDAGGEAVCRQVPQINCFSCASIPSDPDWCQWKESTACDPDPFSPGCGFAACCRPDDTCENLTKNQCSAAEPLDLPREWHFGQLCEDEEHECKHTACLVRQGDCMAVHEGTGCSDPFCCDSVCDSDEFCCRVEWDAACLQWADSYCPRAAANDQCAANFPANGLSGAFDLPMPGVFYGTNTHATQFEDDPGFCCHGGSGFCFNFMSRPCVSDADCEDVGGGCFGNDPLPGTKAPGTVWHKFVATHTTAKISTCGSQAWDERFADSLLQVFVAQDLQSTFSACRSLSVIACNDDAGALCPTEPHNAAVCVGGLVPGHTYYVLLASKLPQHQGLYRITTSAPCTPTQAPGDSCSDAIEISDGVTPFDTSDATFSCPAEGCSPDARNDLWYRYTATCTGVATFSTCNDGSPDTNIAIYDDCDRCPAYLDIDSAAACSADENSPECADATSVSIPVAFGQCYKVRVSDTLGMPVAGELTITCRSGDCQPNGVPDDEDILNCAPDDLACKDCNDNTVPDGCEIRDDRKIDLNLNGKIDSCEPCPSGLISLIAPPSGFIDARRPHKPGSLLELEGVSEVTVAGFPGVFGACWSLCESDINTAMHPPYGSELLENAIVAVSEHPPGQYTLTLKRPLTPGEATFIRYTDDDGLTSSVRLIAHPGNVNGNTLTNPADLLSLIDALNGIYFAPWGPLSTDCDHSGVTAPADLICLIDLLNEGWNATIRPSATSCP